MNVDKFDKLCLIFNFCLLFFILFLIYCIFKNIFFFYISFYNIIIFIIKKLNECYRNSDI